MYVYFHLKSPAKEWHHWLCAPSVTSIINLNTFPRSMFPISEIAELRSMCRSEEMEEMIGNFIQFYSTGYILSQHHVWHRALYRTICVACLLGNYTHTCFQSILSRKSSHHVHLGYRRPTRLDPIYNANPPS